MTPPGDDYEPRQAIQTLSDNLTQPDKFAEIFCNAAKSQKKIDGLLKDSIRDLLKNDTLTRDEIKSLINETNKANWKTILKGLWFAIWSIILIIITTLANRFLSKSCY